MTVSSQKTFHASVAVERHCGGLRGQSSGIGSGQSSGQSSGGWSDLKSDHLVNIRLLEARRANPLGHYSLFPDRWRALLRREFLDAREVAGCFKVSEKAAEKWWGGIGGPNGAKLDYALRELPGAHSFLYGQA